MHLQSHPESEPAPAQQDFSDQGDGGEGVSDISLTFILPTFPCGNILDTVNFLWYGDVKEHIFVLPARFRY